MQNFFYIEKSEAEQILISVFAIAFAFALAIAGFDSLAKAPKDFIRFCFISVATIGAGFIFHELAHKLVAIHYGAHARFQMWVQGLVMMVIFALFGFLFAAPGAVYIYANHISRKENGIISIAGPITNMLISIVFVALAILFPFKVYFEFAQGTLNVWLLGAQINLILAIFNMLPMFPLDGSKVFIWNKFAWFGFLVFCFAFGYFIGILSPAALFMYLILIGLSLFMSGLLRG